MFHKIKKIDKYRTPFWGNIKYFIGEKISRKSH